MLINLLANAVKFTDEGSLALRVRKEEDDRYCFEVSDSGLGIAPEALAMIFEPFNQGPSDHQARRGGPGAVDRAAAHRVDGRRIARGVALRGPDARLDVLVLLRLPPACGPAISQNLTEFDEEPIYADEIDDLAHPPMVTGLTGELRAELISAARLYRVTDLKRCIDQIERLTPTAQAACGYFRKCLSRYDMDALIQSLEK